MGLINLRRQISNLQIFRLEITEKDLKNLWNGKLSDEKSFGGRKKSLIIQMNPTFLFKKL
jgi:hypothetical protein